MNAYPITLISASILGLLLIILSFYTIKMRFKWETSIGDGGHEELLKAIRAHGNFTEHTPLALILVFLIEATQADFRLVLSAGILLVTGRILHAIGLTRHDAVNKFRQIGTMFTWLSILICCLTGLVISFG